MAFRPLHCIHLIHPIRPSHSSIALHPVHRIASHPSHRLPSSDSSGPSPRPIASLDLRFPCTHPPTYHHTCTPTSTISLHPICSPCRRPNGPRRRSSQRSRALCASWSSSMRSSKVLNGPLACAHLRPSRALLTFDPRNTACAPLLAQSHSSHLILDPTHAPPCLLTAP